MADAPASIGNEDWQVSSRTEGSVLHLKYGGWLDASNATEIDDYEDLLLDGNEELTAIVIDARDTTFIDSSGLKHLMTLKRKSENREIKLTIGKASPDVRRLLTITGLDDYFGLPDTADGSRGITDRKQP